MIFCFEYNDRIYEVEAESVVQAIIIIMESELNITDENDFKIVDMKYAS